MAKQSTKQVASNRKAFHDYFIEDKYEAGIELAGTEVKSIRLGAVNLRDSFCAVKDGEMFLYGMHISPYEKGNIFNKDPRRTRKLLLHRREIRKLQAKVQQDGYSLIPLSLYFSGPRVKVELALAKGKKLYDKREAAAQRDAKREIDRAMRSRYCEKERDGKHEQSYCHHRNGKRRRNESGAVPRRRAQHGEQLHRPGEVRVL